MHFTECIPNETSAIHFTLETDKITSFFCGRWPAGASLSQFEDFSKSFVINNSDKFVKDIIVIQKDPEPSV